ncbi:MAG: glycosyltransferase family A protein, partial [Salinisphaeraceae bacterium]|nr:glycosyltransferase family A protein [Salinisphaeraceae bacterium]
MQAPLVSIITPCYNASRTLARTVESILGQTFKNWELLIVDDCSDDDTCEKAESYASNDDRIILVKQSNNGGAAKARNKGIKMARGRYIAFLDADDSWHPKKLAIQIELMQRNNWPLSFTSYSRVDENDRLISKVGVPESVTYKQLLKTNVIG